MQLQELNRAIMNPTEYGLGVKYFKNGKPPKDLGQYAQGRAQINANQGEIKGPGGPTDDQVPAMVSDNEAVLTGVQNGGVEKLRALFGDDIIRMLNDPKVSIADIMKQTGMEFEGGESEGGESEGNEGMDMEGNPPNLGARTDLGKVNPEEVQGYATGLNPKTPLNVPNRLGGAYANSAQQSAKLRAQIPNLGAMQKTGTVNPDMVPKFGLGNNPDDPYKKAVMNYVQGVTNAYQGAKNLASDAMNAASKNNETQYQPFYQAREQGYGYVPAAGIQVKNTFIDPTVESMRNVVNSGLNTASKVNKALFAIPNNAQQKQAQLAQGPSENLGSYFSRNVPDYKVPNTYRPGLAQQQQTEQPPARGATAYKPQQPDGQGRILDDQGFYTVTGDNGATAKVLDWNTLQGRDTNLTNEQYQQQQLNLGAMQNQRNNAIVETSVSSSRNPKTGEVSSTFSTGGFKPELGGVSEPKKQEEAKKFAMENGTIYQQQGSGSPEFNAQAMQDSNFKKQRISDYLQALQHPDMTPEDRAEIMSRIGKLDNTLYLDLVKSSLKENAY